MSDELTQYVKRLDWTRTKQDPEVFYRVSAGGLWYPDAIHKPFLKAAVEELEGLERRYARLRRLFEPED